MTENDPIPDGTYHRRSYQVTQCCAVVPRWLHGALTDRFAFTGKKYFVELLCAHGEHV